MTPADFHCHMAHAHTDCACESEGEARRHRRRVNLHWAAFLLNAALLYRIDGSPNLAAGEFAIAKARARTAATLTETAVL